MADAPEGTVQNGYRRTGGKWQPLTGEAFLSWLAQTRGPEVAAQIKQYAGGELPLPNSRSPLYQQVMPYLLRYDPGASATTFPARAASRKYYSTGPGAAVVTSLDTLGRHGIGLSNSIDELGNLGPDSTDHRASTALMNAATGLMGGPVANNMIANAVAGVTGNDARLVKLKQERTIFGNEFARVLQGGAPHEGEVTAQRDAMNENASPDAQRAYLRTSVAAALQRLEAQDRQFQSANGGGGLSVFDMVDPRVVKAMREIAATGRSSVKMESLSGYAPPTYPQAPQANPNQAAPAGPPRMGTAPKRYTYDASGNLVPQ